MSKIEHNGNKTAEEVKDSSKRVSFFSRVKARLGIQGILVALFFVLLWGVLVFYESALLRRIDNLSLFLYDDLYFEGMTSVPAGMLSYVGCYLIQFFHYPALGAAIYVSMLYLVYFLTRKAFAIPREYALLAMMPVFALLASNTQLGYWIFYLKLPGYYYVAVLAVVLSLLAMWAYRKLGNVWRMPFLLVWVFVGYPVMGVYALASALLMAIMGLFMALRDKNSRIFAVATFAIALMLVYFVPRYFYYYYYDTVDLDLVYYMGVPVQEWWLGAVAEAEHDTESFWHSMAVFKIPFYVLLLSFLLLAASLYLRCVKALRWKYMVCLPYVALLACLLFGLRYWYNDDNFRIENKQNLAMWEGDWKAVVEYASETELPTRQIVVNKNMAMLRVGLGKKGFFGAGDNAVLPNPPMVVKMQHVSGYDTYFYYGKMNYCYRWCMENSVEYGWRPEYLKNAVRSMIATGEYKLAKRYIRILKHTLFHDEWAERMEQLIENPQKIAEDKEFKLPVQFYNYNDILTSEESIEEFVMSNVNAAARAEELNMLMFKAITEGDVESFRHYADEHKGISVDYRNASMMMPLVKKDKELFFIYLDAYLRAFNYNESSTDVKLPRACREAVSLFMALDGGRTMQMSPGLLKGISDYEMNFKSFHDKVKQIETNLKGKYPDITEQRLNAIAAEQLKRQFGETYYYYFFFVKGIRTY